MSLKDWRRGWSDADRRRRYRPPPIKVVRHEDYGSCDRKRRYADEHTARLSAQHILSTPMATTSRLWVYRCDCCRGWHMTKDGGQNASLASVTAAEIYAEDTLVR